MQRKQRSERQRGFALLEVVIAMFILAIGILGAGALQTVGMQSTHGAYFRSQAMLLAADALNRMRANRTLAANYVGTDTNSTSGALSCMNIAAGCSASAMVTDDARQWAALVKNTQSLPGARGQITSPAAGQYVVTITWNENEGQSGTYVRASTPKKYELNVALDNH